MIYAIELERAATRELDAIGQDAAKRILRFPHDRVAQLDAPRSIGPALKGRKLGEFWKYRVGDYRIIAKIVTVPFASL